MNSDNIGLKTNTVRVEKYNDNWPQLFEKEKENLRAIFKNIALEIEHIGSTSVPNLSAKPIIDIAVAVKSFKDFEKVKDKFLNDPYSLKEDSVADEELIRKGYPQTQYLIHVMEIDSPRYKDSIIFRNYLRNHLDALKAYENLKLELAEKYADNRKMYTSSKNDFIKELLNMAYAEIENQK